MAEAPPARVGRRVERLGLVAERAEVLAHARDVFVLRAYDCGEGHEEHAPHRRAEEVFERAVRELRRVLADKLRTVAEQ